LPILRQYRSSSKVRLNHEIYIDCFRIGFRHCLGQRVCVRGERGEIVDDRITYLSDVVTPVTHQLVRHEAGRHGNHEGLHLKGLQFRDAWVYRNPAAPARLNDEEIAIAECLISMQRFVETGENFYSLAEASQDQYLALKCSEAIAGGEVVETTRQIWAD